MNTFVIKIQHTFSCVDVCVTNPLVKSTCHSVSLALRVCKVTHQKD